MSFALPLSGQVFRAFSPLLNSYALVGWEGIPIVALLQPPQRREYAFLVIASSVLLERETRFCRVAVMLSGLLFSGVAFAQSATDETAAIAGVVKGGEGPIVVYLESGDEDPTRYYDGYQVAAEKDGSFSFTNIKPGTYRLRAEAFGFLSAGPGGADGTEITLHARERLKGTTINLVHRRAVCGHVTENGAPKRSTMSAFRYDPKFGTLSSTYPPDTEADGSFWISDFDPGIYYLRAGSTWYPGSFSLNGATPIVVGPDADPAKCVFDIPLVYSGCTLIKVSGQIAGSSTNDPRQYRVNFLERNPDGGRMATAGINYNNSYKAGDSFSGAVCSGDHDVVLGGQQGYVVFDSQKITAGETEITGLVLTPRPMASIAGEVHFDAISRNASCPGVGGQAVTILREGDGQTQSATLDEKNRFEMHDVAPGDYAIYLSPFLREAVYVQSISVNGRAVEGRRVSIPKAEAVTLDITLSGDVARAMGHPSADLRREHRWEVAWTRPKGSVAGKVQRDGEDVGYTVKLKSVRYNSNVSAEYVAYTGAGGDFRFNAVDPGVYTLTAEVAGLVHYEYGAHDAEQRGTPIVVGRGTHVEDLKLSPPKLSAICGRVTDPFGAPRSGLRIYMHTFIYGYLRGRDHEDEVLTDSNGRFLVMGLPPGEYFPSYSYGNRIVYFSNDGSLSGASEVRLRAGESAGCGAATPLELHTPTHLDEWHAISGQVVGDLPKSVGDRFWVTLGWDIHSSGGQASAGTAKVDSEHKFKIERAPNGRFRLQLHSGYGPEPMFWSGPYGPVSHLLATQIVEVHDGDVQDVKIEPVRLPSVSGVVHFENVPAAWKNFDVSVESITLVPPTYRAPFSAKLAADGSFNIDPEDADDYEVVLGQLRAPFSIRSIKLDGHEIKGRYFHLAAGHAANLEVFVSGDSGRVDATVAPDLSLPLAEPPVVETCGSHTWPEYQMILIPDPLPSENDPASSVEPRVFIGYRSGDASHPVLDAPAVAPGRYRAIAAEHLSQGAAFGRGTPWTDDERKLWKAIATLGEPVTVQAGAKLEIVLPDKTIDVARLAARLGAPLEGSLLSVP